MAPPARLGSLADVRREVWRQLQDHIPELCDIEYRDDDVVEDRALRPEPAGVLAEMEALLPHPRLTNDEQLLINTARSWQNRPTAQTVFDNLVMCGDYVRTATDFASMESANESAKRAVNVILDRDRSTADPCAVLGRLPEPEALRGFIGGLRWIDDRMTRTGFPHLLTMVGAPFGWFAGIEQWIRHRWHGDGPDVRSPARARSVAPPTGGATNGTAAVSSPD
jgi:hypothetical protein